MEKNYLREMLRAQKTDILMTDLFDTFFLQREHGV